MENGPGSFARRIRQNKKKSPMPWHPWQVLATSPTHLNHYNFEWTDHPKNEAEHSALNVILFEIHLIKILGASFSDELLATIPGNICKRGFYKKDFSSCEVVGKFQARTVPPKLPDATDRRTSASQKVLSKHLEQLKNWRKEGKVPSSPVGTPRAIVRPECLVSGWGEVEFWGFRMHFFGDGWFLCCFCCCKS